MGPYCVAEDGQTHYCSPNATRTHRSGVYDLKYMARDDRRFWCADANAHRASGGYNVVALAPAPTL